MRSVQVVSFVGCVLLWAACGDDGGDEMDAGGAPMCEGGSVEDWCRHRNCPASPDAAVDGICRGEAFRGFHVENNRCGGKTVHHVVALSHTQYHFDRDGDLVGVTQVGDTPAEGCDEHYITHGKSCTGVTPPPQSRCDDADAGGDDAGS